MSFNPDSDANYQTYLKLRNSLSSELAAEFDQGGSNTHAPKRQPARSRRQCTSDVDPDRRATGAQ